MLARPFAWMPFALAMLFAPGARAASDVRVDDAWIRDAPPGATVRAGYATVVNDGAGAIAITAAASDAFGAIELHEMSMTDGVMRMRRLEAVSVPAHGRVALAPGGTHLMLFRPMRALAAGEACTITLTLADGRTVDATFRVRAP